MKRKIPYKLVYNVKSDIPYLTIDEITDRYKISKHTLEKIHRGMYCKVDIEEASDNEGDTQLDIPDEWINIPMSEIQREVLRKSDEAYFSIYISDFTKIEENNKIIKRIINLEQYKKHKVIVYSQNFTAHKKIKIFDKEYLFLKEIDKIISSSNKNQYEDRKKYLFIFDHLIRGDNFCNIRHLLSYHRIYKIDIVSLQDLGTYDYYGIRSNLDKVFLSDSIELIRSDGRR